MPSMTSMKVSMVLKDISRLIANPLRSLAFISLAQGESSSLSTYVLHGPCSSRCHRPIQCGLGSLHKKELESGNPIAERQEAYDAFFVIKTTPKHGTKVTYNTPAVMQYINRYSGFQILLTNSIKDPVEALQIYRDKDVVEKCFDDLNNQLDMKHLRMHNSATVDGRLFVQCSDLYECVT